MSSRQAASRPPRVATQPRRRHVDSDSSLSTSPSSIQPRRQRAADPPHPQTPSRHSNPRSRHSSSSDSSGLQLSSGPSNPSLARPSTRYSPSQRENLSPSTSLCARSSVETYSSLASAEDLVSTESQDAFDFDDSDIPELPPYKHEIEDYNVRASSPNEFPTLFPSLDRLSIRHDDFTSDGNMNLRIETRIPGRHKEIAQLFHLRMYDLNKREFSLRRYCRSSGREICNSKRRYQDTTDDARPTFQRSMSNAFQSLASRPKARRMSTAASIRSTKSMKSRPGTSYSTSGSLGGGFADVFDDEFALEKKPKARLQPTNIIKLEFSNYARIDLERVGAQDSGKWQYEWWGTNYVWKRVVDRHTDAVSFHLIRDGNKATPVAHIVAETRAPNQVMVDECAGGWIPPCHMWISDPSIIDATTDVADVIVATGLLALVDDCIRIRWQGKKHSRLDHSQAENPRSFVQKLFTRRPSEAGPSPLRFQRAGVAL